MILAVLLITNGAKFLINGMNKSKLKITQHNVKQGSFVKPIFLLDTMVQLYNFRNKAKNRTK